MDDQASSCAQQQQQQQQQHEQHPHRGSVHMAETSNSSSATSSSHHHHHHHQHQLQFASRVSGFPNSAFAEKEDSLSPAVPSLLHLPLCRQAAPVPGLRYRNLGKSGLRVSNVGLGNNYTRRPSPLSAAHSFIQIMRINEK